MFCKGSNFLYKFNNSELFKEENILPWILLVEFGYK
jgi:hypothetical protein